METCDVQVADHVGYSKCMSKNPFENINLSCTVFVSI